MQSGLDGGMLTRNSGKGTGFAFWAKVVRLMRVGDFSMNHARAVLVAAVFCAIASASSAAQDSKATAPKRPKRLLPRSKPQKATSIPGCTAFLKDGEFVQITVEDEGRVTGFVSRYGEGESDKGAFLDQYFRSAKLDGTSADLHHRDGARGVVRFQGHRGTRRRQESRRRGLLRVKGNSHGQHQRCDKRKLRPIRTTSYSRCFRQKRLRCPPPGTSTEYTGPSTE